MCSIRLREWHNLVLPKIFIVGFFLRLRSVSAPTFSVWARAAAVLCVDYSFNVIE